MKRFLCIFLTLAMLCGVLAACGGSGNGGDETTTPTPSNHETTTPADNGGETTTGEEETTTQAPNPIETFVPVLRFVVGSDTHLANTATAEDQRLVKLVQSAYAYSDAHEDYTKLDGIFIVGDCVDKGTQEAMDRYFDIVEDNVREGTFTFSTLGNHEFYTTKYYDGWTVAEVYAETVRMFTEASGQEDVDLHTTIGGYHFIFLSPDTAHGWNFSTAKAQWLAQQLAAASADDPTGRKPIFVFQHEPVKDTVIGSHDGVTTIQSVLNSYSQVVDFSGHSHFPLSDPRSIYQKFFTVLNTGAMKYLTYDINGEYGNATDYEGGFADLTDATVIPDGGAYYIVEVSADNAILVHGYDVDGEAFCMEPLYIPSVGKRSEFVYTEDRAEASDVPAFESNVALTAGEATTQSVTVTFPQAICRDVVKYYQVELYLAGERLATQRLLSGFAQTPVPETRTVTFGGLAPNTEYTVKVIPVSAYEKKGTALEGTVSTAALAFTPTEIPEADVFELVLNTDGTAKNGVSDTVLTVSTAGAPTVVYDETLGRNIANFNRAANWYYEGIAGYYPVMQDSMTFELFFRANSFDQHDAPFSNMQSGGYGIAIYSGGKVEFGIHLNGAYQYLHGSISEGVFVHVVGVYDGTTVKLYVNGVLAEEITASGNMQLPAGGCQFLCVGADSQPSKVGDAPFDGSIAVANVYSTALTQDQIRTLYTSYIG
ncbi:MAG: metallophosphoesterase [Clostridia bacterium]|nr:metallophosphoesterase [Clostridia bacterium]